MTLTRLSLLLIVCLGSLLPPGLRSAHSSQPDIEILATDPAPGSVLEAGDKLYLRIGYRSDLPIRFLPGGYLGNELHEVGASTSSGGLHSVGEGEALAWISFSNPTHIDRLRINLLDPEWQKVGSYDAAIDFRWETGAFAADRVEAPWVARLSKTEFRKKDYLHDPAPRRYGVLADAFFLITLVSVPLYLLVQIQMLRLYRGRWRELAAIPLVAAMPLVIYGAVIGYGFDAHLWLAVIFRCMPFALLYLLTLWMIKRLRGAEQNQGRSGTAKGDPPETPAA